MDGERAIVRTAGGQRIQAVRSEARAGDRVLVLLRPDTAELEPAGGPAGGEHDEGLVALVEDVADPGPIERGRVHLDGGERVTVTRPRSGEGPGTPPRGADHAGLVTPEP